MPSPIPSPRHCACSDWRLSRRSLVRSGGSLVPVPVEALDGLAAFERDGGLSRRDFLANGVGLLALASSLGGTALEPRRALTAAAAAHAASPEAPVLVSLYLDGGNDGLNTLVPWTSPRYTELRPRVGLAPQSLLPLADTADFAWHPSLPGLAGLYGQGKVAVLPAVDFQNADLSHFNSTEYWRKGIVGHVRDPTGWLGRCIDLTGSPDNPLQAISATWNLDPILLSARNPVATVYEPTEVSYWIEGVGNEEVPLALYRALAGGVARYPARAAAAKAYRDAITVRQRLAPLQAAPPDAPPLAYPDAYLGRALRSLARMLAAGFGTRVAAVAHDGGFDTHEQQPEHHARILAELDGALVAWQADLEARGLADRVLTLVWSEFGRRPADNDSLGTDHGAGGLLLVVGNRANGGIVSEFPGLDVLDPLENLRVTTEFRTVYASLLEQWLAIDSERVLGAVPARLQLVRG